VEKCGKGLSGGTDGGKTVSITFDVADFKGDIGDFETMTDCEDRRAQFDRSLVLAAVGVELLEGDTGPLGIQQLLEDSDRITGGET
jgi:hypothetical protein